MITYEFETKEFSATDGYTRIVIRDGVLKFRAEPSAAEKALIEKHGGKLAKPKTKPAARKAASKKDGD